MSSSGTTSRTLGTACRSILQGLLVLLAAGCLLDIVGWTGKVTGGLHGVTIGIGTTFFVLKLWAFRTQERNGRSRDRLLMYLMLASAVMAAVLFLVLLPIEENRAFHLFVLSVVVLSGSISAVHHHSRFTARAFHPGMLLIGSFLAVIAAGTLLLKMPRSVAPGFTCSWLEAAFTSTSAVCVTGLTVQDTATFFSPTGQLIILILIQIGGLGIMTLTFFAAVVLSGGLSLHDRLLLGKMLQENRLAHISRTIGFIIAMTFVCEGGGALFLYATSEDLGNSEQRLFHSVFHSVSGFCNAGFSSLPGGLVAPAVAGNWQWQICLMILIVVGGLGSLACDDICRWVASKARRLAGQEQVYYRLRVHTRLVVAVSIFFIFAGACGILLTEYFLHRGPNNGGRLMTATFHSVTARTAGFNTVPMGGIGPLTIQILMVLMLVGGSPGGTAGGLRTTVVAAAMGHLWELIRSSQRGMIVFNRMISRETGSQALAMTLLAVLWLAINFIILQVFETGKGFAETHLLFELVSAFATVGLSLDLTAALTDQSKALLILNMFVGRIGLLTVITTLVKPDCRPRSGKPAEDILLV